MKKSKLLFGIATLFIAVVTFFCINTVYADCISCSGSINDGSCSTDGGSNGCKKVTAGSGGLTDCNRYDSILGTCDPQN